MFKYIREYFVVYLKCIHASRRFKNEKQTKESWPKISQILNKITSSNDISRSFKNGKLA